MFILPLHLDKAKVILYADDTAIFHSHKDTREIERVLTDQLTIAQRWLSHNKLTLNLDKTKCMILGSRQKTSKNKIDIALNDSDGVTTKIDETTTFKYLGVWIDQNLSWNTHLDFICGKISQRLGILRRCRKFLTQDTATLLFNAMILPLFDYADIVWRTCSKTNLTRLDRLQRRGARIILECKIRDLSSADLLDSLRWLPLQNRRDFHTVTMVYKCTHNLAPGYLSSLFSTSSKIHSYATRQASNLHLNQVRASLVQKSFTNLGASLYNKLPPTVKNAPSLTTFKSKYLANLKL